MSGLNTFDFVRRIEALEAERDALLAEVAPLRELRAAGVTPSAMAWEHRSNPGCLTMTIYDVEIDRAKSITGPLHRCLFGNR